MTVDLLAIVAHPDDAELLCGGKLAKTAAQGNRAGILDLTAGESGSAGSVEERAREAAEAARILGVSRHCAALPDSRLQDDVASRTAVAGWIRKLQPRVVITHWPDARHPDHAATSRIVQAACFLAGLRNYRAEGAPHRPRKLLYSLTYQESNEKPTFVVDISDFFKTKLDAIFAFNSQFFGKTAMGDVLGGERPLQDQLVAHHAHYGSLIRKPYGEPFWTRETIRVDDVLNLDVSTF